MTIQDEDDTYNKKQHKRDANDLMFPTEIDHDYVIMESEEDYDNNQNRHNLPA